MIVAFGPTSWQGITIQVGIGAVAIGILSCAIWCLRRCYQRPAPVLPTINLERAGPVAETSRVAFRALTEST